MRVLSECSWDIISTEVLLRYYENAIRMLLMYYWDVVQALLECYSGCAGISQGCY